MSQLSEPLEQRVYAEQVRLLYKALPASIVANFAAGSIFVGLQWNVINHRTLISWLLVFNLMVVVRAVTYFKYSRADLAGHYSFWGRAFVAGSALAGMLWGSAGIFLFPHDNQVHQLVLLFALLGMSAGSVSSHSFLKPAPYLFVFLCLTPVFFQLLFERTHLGNWMAVTIVLCVAYLIAAAKRNCEATVDHIRQKFDAIEKEREVEQSRQEAEKANQAKSEFLSSMSHELRTPLNAIVGFGQLLDESVTAQNDRESVFHILRAGRHLTDMINDILDIARIESGHYGLSPEAIPLNKVLIEAWELVQPLASERDIKLIDFKPEDCTGAVFADLQRFKQVILNFLSNAIKYNRQGGIVGFKCSMQDNNQIRISVIDNGPGLTPDEQQRAFEPFERLKANTSTIEGSGIGLSLCRTLVAAMGGRIGVISQPGEGSEFWIEFSAISNEQLVSALQVKSETESYQLSNTETLKILYIEDNIANLQLIEAALKLQQNVELVAAMQGELGYDLAKKSNPDLILLDLHLPDINGDEVLARLKSNPDTCGIPVIIISADATLRQIESLKTAGAFAYLTKPFDLNELWKKTDAALSMAKSSSE